MSVDEQLQVQGTETHINYQADFLIILEYLCKGIQDKRKSVLNIFCAWDAILFPNCDAEDGCVKVAWGTEQGEKQRALETLEGDKIEEGIEDTHWDGDEDEEDKNENENENENESENENENENENED